MQNDLYDAVDDMVRRGVTNPDSASIMGTSYGGYATLAALSMAPERFRCGVAIAAPSNLATLFDSIPPSLAAVYSQFTQRMGDPSTKEGKELLANRSPLTFAANIKAPLLIGHGANDPRVKQTEADQIVASLKAKKIPVSYILYPDEGHGFARPQNRESFNAITEQFLGKCLGGAVEPVGLSFEKSSLQIIERGHLELPG
jgi:dipeptidyl aminopeptidase/acylaminoacyl peptidase